jgi:hypothetical protein
MEYFTKRNTVILGLVQGGVVGAGVLAAGVYLKWCAMGNARPSALPGLLAEYGVLALVVPLAWVAIALWMQRNEDPEVKVLAFASGILLVLLLLVGVVYATVVPFVRLMGCGGLSG